MSSSPPPTIIQPQRGWAALELGALWRHRELIYFLALRDIQVRYKQTIFGVAWAVIPPLATAGVFNLIFGLLLSRPQMPTTAGVPYLVSTYCAMVPWRLFSTSLASSGNSLVANQHLITKVYFPRLVAPVAPILSALVDFGVALVVLLGLLAFFGITPGWELLALPLFVLFAVVASLAVSLWLSALNALFRDVRHTLTFLTQLWMYATPVVYTTESVMKGQPDWVRAAYGLNPMAGVVEGFRWALLGGAAPPWPILLSSVGVVLVLLVGGAFFFRRMERTIVDLV